MRAKLAAAATASLLLAACGYTPQATTPQPVATQPTRSLGLYELHIEGRGGQVTGRVTRVGGNSLGAQEISGLSFAPTAVTTNTDASSNKHYSAVISVTNGSGKDISQPLYVPVAVTGYTQSGTYFSNAKASDGATSTDPSGISIERGQYNSGGVIQPDPGATPLVSVNIAPGLVSVPAGASVSSLSPQAWQAPNLPSGGNQNVTFGFNVPAANTTYSFNVVFSVFATPAVNHLVISQVYGGGGNTGATLKNDFIELFNPTNSVLSTQGMSVQYTSNTGTFSPANGTVANSFALPTKDIQPGGYFLVQAAAGTGGTADLPTPDAIGSLAMSGTGGKVALASDTAAVTFTAPNTFSSNVVDFVGWGTTANAYEGAGRAPATTNTTAVLRAGNGCTDTNTNSADFTAATAAPRSSASAINLCQ